MTAPTKAEVRESLLAAIHEGPGLTRAGEFADAFNGIASGLDDIYDTADLRQSERDRLDELACEAMCRVRNQAFLDLIEALVGAGLAFAAEHPDAPRKRQPITA
jgi:hypothetical protein